MITMQVYYNCSIQIFTTTITTNSTTTTTTTTTITTTYDDILSTPTHHKTSLSCAELDSDVYRQYNKMVRERRGSTVTSLIGCLACSTLEQEATSERRPLPHIMTLSPVTQLYITQSHHVAVQFSMLVTGRIAIPILPFEQCITIKKEEEKDP